MDNLREHVVDCIECCGCNLDQVVLIDLTIASRKNSFKPYKIHALNPTEKQFNKLLDVEVNLGYGVKEVNGVIIFKSDRGTYYSIVSVEQGDGLESLEVNSINPQDE